MNPLAREIVYVTSMGCMFALWSCTPATIDGLGGSNQSAAAKGPTYSQGEKSRALEERLARGEEAFRRSEWESAIAEFESVLRIVPSHEHASLRIAEARDKKWQADVTRQGRISEHFQRAKAALDAGSPAAAINEYQEILKLDRDHAQARAELERARSLLVSIERKMALRAALDRPDGTPVMPELEAMVKRDPKDGEALELLGRARLQVEAWRREADAELRRGRRTEAMRLYEQIRGISPDDEQAGNVIVFIRQIDELNKNKVEAQLRQLREGASLALERSDWSGAGRLAEEALRLEPNDPEVRRLKQRADLGLEKASAERRAAFQMHAEAAEEALKKDDLLLALRSFVSALEIEPNDGPVRARFMEVRQQYEELVVEQRRQRAGEFRRYADDRFARGDLTQAIYGYEQAISLDPSDMVSRIKLDDTIRRKRETDQKRIQAETARHLIEGDRAFEASNFEGAVRSYLEVLRRDSRNEYARNRREEALKRIPGEQQVVSPPSEAKVYAALLIEAREALGKGYYSEAEQKFRQLLELNPTNDEAIHGLDKTKRDRELAVGELFKKGKNALDNSAWRDAIEAFEKMLELEPTLEAVRTLLVRAREGQRGARTSLEEQRTRIQEAINRGDRSRAQGFNQDALAAYEEALRIDVEPEHAMVLARWKELRDAIEAAAGASGNR